jgi:deoxycytidine triphosphate deaminase
MDIEHNYELLVLGYSPFRISPVSLDLTASNRAYIEHAYVESENSNTISTLIDVKSNSPLKIREIVFEDFVIISPESCITIETNEIISLDDSHWASFYSVGGLNMANIAVIGGILIQPNYYGSLKITLRNFNKRHSYKLYKEQVVGQLVVIKKE